MIIQKFKTLFLLSCPKLGSHQLKIYSKNIALEHIICIKK